MTTLDSKSRLRWACRRGMLELDVLFQPFLDEEFDNLTLEDKHLFQRLLTGDDPVLFAWMMGKENCPDSELAYMVNKIVARVKV